MNRSNLSAILLILMTVIFFSCNIKEKKAVLISAEELAIMFEQSEEMYLIDVHIPKQEHIPNTDIFIPFNEIAKNLDKLPKDKDSKIVLYCRSGNMSNTASKELISLGYKNVFDLKGGKKAWDKLKLNLPESP